MNDTGTSLLRQRLEEACEAAGGLPLKDMTVLSTGNDPFRVDTERFHEAGRWLAEQIEHIGYGDRKTHLRGLHYAISQADETILKPDGTPYRNVEKDWQWLQRNAGKGARWLGYVPFDRIVDERNAEPVIREAHSGRPFPWISCDLHVEIPETIEPTVWLEMKPRQPFRLVLFGEKASLDEVLQSVADYYGADLYLATGEISDTLIHKMARTGVEDGRPLVVVTFADCDPSGWQMSISIARKLQAFRELPGFDDLEYMVIRGGLRPDQVREFGLPHRPLKGTERRADDWRERQGVDQTEIDALTTPRTEKILREIAMDAVRPFHDDRLDIRTLKVRQEWEKAAQQALDATVDADDLGRLRAQAEERLEELRAEVNRIGDELRFGADRFDLPPVPDPPEPELNGHRPRPLIDSAWTFEEQTRALIASKAYRDHEPTEEETP